MILPGFGAVLHALFMTLPVVNVLQPLWAFPTLCASARRAPGVQGVQIRRESVLPDRSAATVLLNPASRDKFVHAHLNTASGQSGFLPDLGRPRPGGGLTPGQVGLKSKVHDLRRHADVGVRQERLGDRSVLAGLEEPFAHVRLPATARVLTNAWNFRRNSSSEAQVARRSRRPRRR